MAPSNPTSEQKPSVEQLTKQLLETFCALRALIEKDGATIEMDLKVTEKKP